MHVPGSSLQNGGPGSPVAACIAAMDGEAEHGRAELNLLAEPALITAFHCALHLIVARRMAAGGPLMSF